MLRRKVDDKSFTRSGIYFLKNLFNIVHIFEDGIDLHPLMSLSFYRAKDKFTNFLEPESSAELKFSRYYLNGI